MSRLLVGINCTSPYVLPMARSLIERGVADFCEVMLDNVVHLPPTVLRRALPSMPLSLHIVASRFLERDEKGSVALAAYLREWIDELQPIYVSDHLARYTENGRYLPILAELDYEAEYQRIKEKITQWQALLGVPLLLENYASMTAAGAGQAEFFQRLQQDTNAGLLFDISNAYIAEKNQVLAMSAWALLASHASHFHVGGFRKDSKTGYLLDTHDIALADDIYPVIQQIFLSSSTQKEKTIVVEFDAKQNIEIWCDNILKIKETWGVMHAI